MNAPEFWWDDRTHLSAKLLAPISGIYGAFAARPFGKGAKADLPLVCLGNFTLGGAGKTPFCLALAEALIAKGRKPAFLSRGHGGAEQGPLRVDRSTQKASDVGDEPLLLAVCAPTYISKDRVVGAALIAADGEADLIIMDDGFQSAKLHPDRAILVVDGNRGIGNGRVIPAGPLRAPLDVQMDHTDRIVVVNSGATVHSSIGGLGVLASLNGVPVNNAAFHLVSKPDPEKSYFAYCGIGNPNKFYQSLDDASLTVVGRRAFGDHQEICAVDASEILKEVEALNATPITTTKDRARMLGVGGEVSDLLQKSEVLEVTLAVQGMDALAAEIAAL